MSDRNSKSEREAELDNIIADYLQAVDAGESPNRRALIAEHHEFSHELSEFFSDQQRLHELEYQSTLAPTESFIPVTAAYCPPPGPQKTQQETANDTQTHLPFVLAGRYRVFDVKAGGMGRVYLAEDLKARALGTILNVALKTVPDYAEWRRRRLQKGSPDGPADYADLLARFHREALAWVRLGTHNNIVFAGYVLTIGGRPHLWLEHIDGGDLAGWIRGGSLSVARSVNYALQFCAGMQHAVRTTGMVHRDIKPGNVLIKDGRIVKITDFGLSRAYGTADRPAEDSAADDGSGTGSSLAGGGTRSYMPPEQFRSLASADTRSDIFSFGVMLFEMLTRRKLFAARDAFQMSLAAAPLPYACELNPEVPGPLSDVVRRCVQYVPEDRYQSFDELVHDLQQINDALPDRLPIPHDTKVIPPEKLTPSIRVEGQAYSLISLGRYDEAVRHAELGIEAESANSAHSINRGTALMHLSDFAAARDCYRRAIELAPLDARSWSGLGEAELRLGRPAAGLTASETAVRRNPQFAEGWMCRGRCQQDLGLTQEAVHSLTRAAELEPHNWKMHAFLAAALGKLGRINEALAAYARAAELNSGDATIWFQLGWLYSQTGRHTEARTALQRSLDLNPENDDTRALLGWVLRSMDVPT